jgi:trk system potassium uptake protein TrkA
MYIIIVGCGKVGAATARELVATGHEVLVIDHDIDRIRDISEELGDIGLFGDGAEVHFQSQAGMERADMVVAATGRDETNLAVVQVAKHRYKVPMAIARVNDPRNEEIFRVLGVDAPISATQAILAHIEQELPSHPLIHLLEFHASDFELVEVVVPKDAPSVGKTVSELDLPPQSMLPLIMHPDGRPEVPGGETVIQGGAVILAVTLPEHENALRRAFTGAE